MTVRISLKKSKQAIRDWVLSLLEIMSTPCEASGSFVFGEIYYFLKICSSIADFFREYNFLA